MVKSASFKVQGPGESSLAIPVQLAHLGSGEEHVALLVDTRRFGLLRRWDDLFDEGVAALFGMTGGGAELVGLCFHAGKFIPAESTTWLAGRSFKPLLFVPNAGRLAAAEFDVPTAAPVGRAVFREQAGRRGYPNVLHLVTLRPSFMRQPCGVQQRKRAEQCN